MMYKHDYVPNIIGMNTDAQILPIHKLEPEIIPTEDVFGIVDTAATRELISVLKDNTINRINICFPLDEKDEKLVKLTFEAIQNMLEGGIRVSMSNIDTIDKVKFAQQESGNNISYFSKATVVPAVEKYCRDNNIPFLPGASDITEFGRRKTQGYRAVKAYPFVKNQLMDIINLKNSKLLYNPAGGITPVLMDNEGNPKEVSDFFLKCAGLENVINISATDPAKCLIKSSNNPNPLEKFNTYLQLVLKG